MSFQIAGVSHTNHIVNYTGEKKTQNLKKRKKKKREHVMLDLSRNQY